MPIEEREGFSMLIDGEEIKLGQLQDFEIKLADEDEKCLFHCNLRFGMPIKVLWLSFHLGRKKVRQRSRQLKKVGRICLRKGREIGLIGKTNN